MANSERLLTMRDIATDQSYAPIQDQTSAELSNPLGDVRQTAGRNLFEHDNPQIPEQTAEGNKIEIFIPQYPSISGIAAFPWGEPQTLKGLGIDISNNPARARADIDVFHWDTTGAGPQKPGETNDEYRERLHPVMTKRALELAAAACAVSGTTANEVDHLVLATTGGWPGLGKALKDEGGFDKATVFHAGASCPGGSLVWYHIKNLAEEENLTGKKILVESPEVITFFMKPDDINKTLFGDVGSSVYGVYGEDFIVSAAGYKYYPDTKGALCVRPFYPTDEPGEDYIVTKEGMWAPMPAPKEENLNFVMNGRRVYTFVCKRVPEAVTAFLSENEINPAEIDLLACHQANKVLVDYLNRELFTRLGLPEADFVNGHLGNNSAASTATALLKSLQMLPQLDSEQRQALDESCGYNEECLPTGDPEAMKALAAMVADSSDLKEGIKQRILEKLASLQKPWLEAITVSFGAGLAVSYAHLKIRNPYLAI
jgi:3-oxoacyl-[acyl-carrier-protein] synthase III